MPYAIQAITAYSRLTQASVKSVSRLCISSLILMLLFVAAPPLSAAEDEDSRGDLALTGDAICTRCHDEYEYYPVLTIGQTPHGTRADSRTPNCTSCHGDSDNHINETDDDGKRLSTDIRFRKAPSSAEARSDACSHCHSGNAALHWQASAHARQEVACNDCHQIHNQGKDPMFGAQTQADRCFDCHQSQRSDSLKFYRHALGDAAVSCSSCHNPHGSGMRGALTRVSVVDTCYQCHAEKRGPYLWQHQPVNEDCTFCHQPHGSNIPGMLTARVPLLCQTCHEGDGHRGMPPSSDSLLSSRRGCVNCHTNIHGSNSPSGSFGARSLRR